MLPHIKELANNLILKVLEEATEEANIELILEEYSNLI